MVNEPAHKKKKISGFKKRTRVSFLGGLFLFFKPGEFVLHGSATQLPGLSGFNDVWGE